MRKPYYYLFLRFLFISFLLSWLCVWGIDYPLFAKEKRNSSTRSNPGKNQSVRRAAKRTTVKKVGKNHTVTRAKAANSATMSSASMSTISLMGAGGSNVAVKSRQLSGAVYYLASGHGGPDPGAIGHFGKAALAEDEYAYDVTLRLARSLIERGATVYMIIRDPNDGIRDEKILKIDHDEVTYPNQKIPLNQTARLRQCTEAVNKLYHKHKGAYQRMITIHVDSRSVGEKIDVFFYHHDQSSTGKKLAKRIHRTFNARYKQSQPGRSYLGTVSDRSSLYVVKNCLPPTVFIELGNIRNDKDQRRFLIAGNRQALANWICEGMSADYGKQ